jgi:predicted O-methyltransferase YrrM
METFTSKDFKVRAGSHLPLLIKLVFMTDGPILELGTGFYSTPVLHWLCAENKRKLISYESSERYFEVARRYISDWHEVNFVTDWSKIDTSSNHWGVVFVDHYPAQQRRLEIERVADNAEFVIAHDSELKHDKDYQYSKIAPLFKYRYDYNKFYPNTVVFSNFFSIDKLKI